MDLDTVGLEVLRGELAHQVLMNAASGYVLDPRLPAPEVFERPKWKVLAAPPGMGALEMHRLAEPQMVTMVAFDAPPTMPEIERVTIRPAVQCWVESWVEKGTAHFYGLGFDEGSRTFVFFRLGTGPVPERNG